MSIWDDISKGMSDAASYTVKKTEKLTSLAKMKLALHNEEVKLDKCFEEVGRLYYAYQRKGSDYVSELASLLLTADELKANIKKMVDDLAKIQNNTICPGCKTKISNDALYCPICGLKQEKQDGYEFDSEDDSSDDEINVEYKDEEEDKKDDE